MSCSAGPACRRRRRLRRHGSMAVAVELRVASWGWVIGGSLGLFWCERPFGPAQLVHLGDSAEV